MVIVSCVRVAEPIASQVRAAGARFGHELRLAAGGLSQREIADRAGISQSHLSRVMHGRTAPTLELMIRLCAAVGHRYSFKLYPTIGVGLRDSGQLRLADMVRAQAAQSWRVRFEVPVSRSPDLRAADMVLDNARAVVLVEIERGLFDFQAQLRAAQLKRVALAELVGHRVALMIGVPDTRGARAVLAGHASLIGSALPVPSRTAWAAIRSGEAVGGDALLWIRPRTDGSVRLRQKHHRSP